MREPGGDEPWLYLKPLFLAEMGVARAVRKLCGAASAAADWTAKPALGWVEKKMGLQLARHPARRHPGSDARENADRHRRAGDRQKHPRSRHSGIVRRQESALPLCAPTGRAAKRLSETTGREAKTIHRLLEFDPVLGGFKRDVAQQLDLDLLVVDEASMVDMVLMYQLLRAVPAHACVVLVGDVDQLPSVGPGLVLADLIDSKTVPVVRLTEIFRQAGQSWIVRRRHAIKHGELPESAPAGKGDFYFIEANTPETVLERILVMVRDASPPASDSIRCATCRY